MLLYTDIFSNDELVSDAFPITEAFNGVLMKVESKVITIGAVEVNTGANASAEEADEGVEDTAQKVNNVEYSGRLSETSFDKKSFMGYIKAYIKRVTEHLTKNNPTRVDQFKKDATEAVKHILANFDDYSFLLGESFDAEAHVVLKFYEGENPNPFFFFWRDGLKEVKC